MICKIVSSIENFNTMKNKLLKNINKTLIILKSLKNYNIILFVKKKLKKMLHFIRNSWFRSIRNSIREKYGSATTVSYKNRKND